MQLEDHLGDIVRKARAACDVSAEAAANAAGLPLDQFASLEKSGAAPEKMLLVPLAKLIGLNPAKLQNIARGWLPPPIDLTSWRELRVITTTEDGITVNCYLVWDEVSREAALFDTGWDAKPIVNLVSEHQLHPKHLFLTHTDDDHVAAMAALRERFPKLLLHTNSKNVPPQHRNRAMAMDMLKARLYEAELQRREAEAAKTEATKTDIGWGHQIRSYVLQPYQMVKDLRTGVETSDTGGVLDGDLDRFMAAALALRLGDPLAAKA